MGQTDIEALGAIGRLTTLSAEAATDTTRRTFHWVRSLDVLHEVGLLEDCEAWRLTQLYSCADEDDAADLAQGLVRCLVALGQRPYDEFQQVLGEVYAQLLDGEASAQ